MANPANVIFRNLTPETKIVPNPPAGQPVIATKAELRDGSRPTSGGGDPLSRPLAQSFADVGFGYKGAFTISDLPENVAGTFIEGRRFSISADGQKLYFRGGRDDNTYTYVPIPEVGGITSLPLPSIADYGKFRSMSGGWGYPVGGAVVNGVLYVPYATIYDTGNGMDGRVLVGYDPDTLEQVTGTAKAQYQGSLSGYSSYNDGTGRPTFTTRKAVGPLREFPPEWAAVFGYPCYMTPGVAHSIASNSNRRHGFTLVDPTQLTTSDLTGFQDIDVKPVLYDGGPSGAGSISYQGPRNMDKVPPEGFVLPDGFGVIDSENLAGCGREWGWDGAEGMAGGGWIIPGTRTFVYMVPAAMTGTAGKGWGLRDGGTSYQGDQYECLAFFYDLAEIKEVADGTRAVADCLPYHYEKMPGVQEDISTGMGRWINIWNTWSQGNFVNCPVTGNVYGYVGGTDPGPFDFYNPNTGQIDTRTPPYNLDTGGFGENKQIFIWGQI
ncbi:MAG: hypothetical protein Tp1111DCM1126091_122 [Prokaryotic dsDNA virus sp.]|nr:MAG: hypothetical protein Tp1111DCM1126091_122 [Prokaryotic dsDNA virus sp.]|tara:strand:- start:28626 stop:30107 length:1482 start_codon:yes stop_codon:yes gene_type:complete